MKKFFRNQIAGACGAAGVEGLKDLSLKELIVLNKSLKNKTLRRFVKGLFCVTDFKDIDDEKTKDFLYHNQFVVAKERNWFVCSYGQSARLVYHESMEDLVSFCIVVETIHNLTKVEQ